MKTAEIELKTCPDCEVGYEVELMRSLSGNMVPMASHCDDCLAKREDDVRKLTLRKPITALSAVKGYGAFDFYSLPPETQLPARDFIFEWQHEGATEGVGLAGVSGLGKTFTIMEMARRCENDGALVAVVLDSVLGSIVRPEKNWDRASLLSDVRRADIVVWDDFARTKMTEGVESLYNELLEIIYGRQKPILGTCQFSANVIKQIWCDQNSGNRIWLEDHGERLIRRFRERCNLHKIEK